MLSSKEQVIQNYLVCSSRDVQLRVLMLRYDICACIHDTHILYMPQVPDADLHMWCLRRDRVSLM